MTQAIETLIKVLSSIFNIYLVLSFFKIFLKPRPVKRIYFFLFSFVSGSLILLVSLLSSSIPVREATCFAAYLLIVFALYGGNFPLRLLLPFLYLGLETSTEMITGIALSRLENAHLETLGTNLLLEFQGQIICSLLLLILIRLIAEFKKTDHSEIPVLFSVALLNIPIVSILICYEIVKVNAGNTFNVIFVIIGAGILYINMIVFSLLEWQMRQAEQKLRFKLSEQRLEIQIRHYEKLAKDRREIEGLLHDTKNHFVCISSFAHVGATGLIEEYIGKLNSTILKGYKTVETGHPVIDAILEDKKEAAERAGIRMSFEIMLPKKVEIDNVDICIILGNILDNAIEACENISTEEPEKEIKVKIVLKGIYFVISVANTVEPGYKFTLEDYATSKPAKEMHGFGLSHVAETTEKYNGNLQVLCENDLFTVNILLQTSPVK